MRERPIGVTILAVLAALGGAVAIWYAVELLGGADEASVLLLPRLAGLARLLALLALVVGALEFVFAFGAFNMRTWAWSLGVSLEIVFLAMAVLRLGRGVPGSHLVAIVLTIVTLWYLFRPEVRRAFAVR
jgi:uncharacterized membrane protein (DUF2068 family)